MSTHNIGFYEEISKIISISNMHFMCSSVNRPALQQSLAGVKFRPDFFLVFVLQTLPTQFCGN